MSAFPGNCVGMRGCVRGGMETKSLRQQVGLWSTVSSDFLFSVAFFYGEVCLTFSVTLGVSKKDISAPTVH